MAPPAQRVAHGAGAEVREPHRAEALARRAPAPPPRPPPALRADPRFAQEGAVQTRSASRCLHFNLRDAYPQLAAPPTDLAQPAGRVEVIVDPGGLTNVGYALFAQDSTAKIGTMVAGNSGRPGGACGMADGTVDKLHAYHRTQEEDVLSNWLLTECDGQPGDASRIYRDTIHGQWGMKEPEGTDAKTIQRVDYRNAREGVWYADAWVVDDASLSRKEGNPSLGGPANGPCFDFEHRYPSVLCFVAGPNAGAQGRCVPAAALCAPIPSRAARAVV